MSGYESNDDLQNCDDLKWPWNLGILESWLFGYPSYACQKRFWIHQNKDSSPVTIPKTPDSRFMTFFRLQALPTNSATVDEVVDEMQRLTVFAHGVLSIYTVSQKKLPTFKLSVTLSNLNRFSKFLHCWKAYKICYKNRVTLPTSPKACCYTTLRN